MIITFDNCFFYLVLLFTTQNVFTDPLTAISIKQPIIGSQQHQSNIFSDVSTVVGGRASLPCDIRMSSSSDSITLVLWYRGEHISGATIYSVDARNINNKGLETAQHFINERFSGRISFNLTIRPALLTIDPIIDSDSGQYWCRVDFKWKRTTISAVTLNVIVPPNEVFIKLKNDKNSEEKVLSNLSSVLLNEGSTVTFLCESHGGKPLPIINWFINEEPIGKELTNNFVKDNNTVQSELYFNYINSSDLNTILKCQTSNDNQTFISSSITFHINLRPISVTIVSINDNKTLLSGMRTSAICRSFGSRPAAVHSWFLSSKPITRITNAIIADVNVGQITQSMATFVPTPEDNGSHLICRAENALLHNSVIEDKKILEVRFAPKATLTFSGIGINGITSYLIRGNDLRLYCNISANPSNNRIVWFHNSNQLFYDIKKGVVNTDTTLVVKNVSKEWNGLYQCVAHNSEGSGFSNLLEIQVYYPPKCLSPTQTIPGIIGRPVFLFCEVDTSLLNVTFFWYSKHIHKTDFKIVNKRLKSELIINLKSEEDFGQYSCWAKNLAGNQMDPCIFYIYEKKLKQQLICETNISLILLRVECLQQKVSSQQDNEVLYNLKIYYDRTVLKNITSIEPIFNVHFKEFHFENNSTPYQILIISAINGRVVSDVNIMLNIPNHKNDNYIESNRSIAISHYNSVRDNANNKHEFVSRVWIAFAIALTCSLTLSIIIVITFKVCLICKSVKRKRLQNRKKERIEMFAKQSESTSLSISTTVEQLVLNPDVIPSAIDVSNNINGNSFIKDCQLTYENKNDINARLQYNHTSNKLPNQMNRVTVLSDFHTNVIDWDSIQVNHAIQ